MNEFFNKVLELIGKIIPGFNMSDPLQQQIVLAFAIAVVLFIGLRASGLKWWVRLLYALGIGALSFAVHYIMPGDYIGFAVAVAIVFLAAFFGIWFVFWLGRKKGKKESQYQQPES